jgi:hypothetical protein
LDLVITGGGHSTPIGHHHQVLLMPRIKVLLLLLLVVVMVVVVLVVVVVEIVGIYGGMRRWNRSGYIMGKIASENSKERIVLYLLLTNALKVCFLSA